MNRLLLKSTIACVTALFFTNPASAQRQMERLGRGIVAVRTNSTQVYIGWRLLGNDPPDVAFNLYRSANGATAVKINATPLTATSDYLDTPPNLAGTGYSYSVKPVLSGVETQDIWAHPSSTPFTLPVAPPTRQYIPVPIRPTPDDTPTASYRVKFCWVGDLDGDGEYDFVVDRTNPNVEARQWLQAYKRDGTLLWQMNMGPNSVYHYNIEPGSSAIGIGHGDNVTVYDMDGDGKSEVIVRTSNGVVFGNGAVVSGGASDNAQFLSIVNGMTGAEMARAPVPNPRLADGPMNGHMGIAYLDGLRPSVILAAKNRDSNNDFHGVITAWDWRGGALGQRWSWMDSGALHAPEGHQIRIADVDNDGKDEFVDIGYVLDDNGTQLFNIGEIVHGDRFHLTDIDPDRPGLENFVIQQNNGTGLATALFDPGNGRMIRKWYAGGVVDVGRGVVADMDPSWKGCEFFSTQPGIYNSKGVQIYPSQPFPPEAIWWDADLSREFIATVGSTAESPAISKFNPANPGGFSRLYTIYNETPPGVYQAYGGRPAFWGDILGDWREELLCVANDNSELRIYTPKTGSVTRIYTLMHNPQYRMQATTKGYVQANYVDYYLGTGMTPPPPAPMADAKLTWRGGPGNTVWDTTTPGWLNGSSNSTFTNGDSVRFDIGANNTTTIALSGTLQPSSLTFSSPKSHVFDGSGGSLSGTMPLVKNGAGGMTLTGNHNYTGRTTVWDGALILNGNLQQSPVTVWGGIWGGAPAAGLTGGRIGGTGTFSQPVTLGYRGAITPGDGMGSAGTLNFTNGLTAQDGSYFAFDLAAGPAGTSDRIAITGNLSLAGKVGIVIKALEGTLSPGTYTLATYSGTLTGNVSNFAVTVPPGTPHTLTAGSGQVNLIIPVTRPPASVVWRGSGGAWDLAGSANWLAEGEPDVFVSGDHVTFNGSGSASPIATLTGALPVGSLTVNSASDYTLTGSGSISGSGGLTKSGTGTLTISTVNDYTGPTLLNGGVLAIDSLGDAGTPGSIGAATAAAGNFVINGGTLRLTGSQTNTNRSLTLAASGGGFDIATNGSSMQISGAIGGSGGLVKTGPGTLILAKANTYTGGTTINQGTIYLAGSSPNSSGLGSGSVTLNNGTLTMANVQASETAAWNVVVPTGATGRLNADGRCSLTGSLTGGGVFNFYTPYVRTDLKGNWSAFSGRINLIGGADGGEMRVTNTFGFAGSSINVGENGFVYYNISSSSPTLDIGELTGSATSGIGGGPTAGRTVTWRIGGKNTDAAFAGAIVNSTGTTAVTKIGSGIWTLSGASTHTGATLVSTGTLRVDGSTTGSNLTVSANAALGGTGIITGNVVFQNGAVLEHGTPGATPPSIKGNLTLGTTLIVRPIPGTAPVAGTHTLLTYTGTLAGTPALSWQAPADTNLVATFDISTPGTIIMTLAKKTGTANLAWTGATSSNWDTTSANWTNAGSNLAFSNGSIVSFTDAGNATNPVNIPLDVEPDEIIVNATKDYTFSGNGKIIGETALGKSGAGVLNIATANTYSGGTMISGGTLSIGNAAALGSGPVTLAGGTWATGALTPGNPIIVTANSTITGGSGSGAQGIKAVSGSHTLTLTATNVFDIEGSLTDFSGTISLNGSGSFRLFGSAGSPNAAFDLGTRGLGSRSGSAFALGSLTGAAGSTLGGAGGYNSAVTYAIGGNNTSTTFSGSINNGNTAGNAGNITHLLKTGGGSLTLAGTNNYTGNTTINTGRLLVTGSLANTAVTVAATATLGGSGSIAGAVTCHGTLSPGAPIGTLTLANGLTLSPTSVLHYELGSSPDKVAVTGNLTLAGTLNVTPTAGFTAGNHILITYTGTLTDDDGLQIGTLPAGYEATISTTTPGEVRLIVTQDRTPFEEWQLANFGSTSDPNAGPAADPDGDGTLNETEFRLGLDPKSGASSFKATGAITPSGFTLTWPSAAGLVFEVRRGADPAGPWELLETLAPITDGPGHFTDSEPPPTGAFYRIILLP
ncbi:autotransporter-associated beta strand repeat-containing protein [Luteolibacter yonseiensis]|uniref:Autotransporter-associated beta strand repeat-containing protein n=1 Tax=Luteolibacter yonseiensis TaxID=1144680 RepID=A0A934R7H2_9BACT|nr:autotransporter-associated beta strand repeat-containing protein [Luteolibacter yonseiensis]MBK1816870.1 autotransporter-associated beta strand repeat-containing protein [Luteolibacter yonseiensis]